MIKEFQCRDELSALNRLTHADGFQLILDTLHSACAELSTVAELQGRNFLITNTTYPRLFDLYQTAAERLKVKKPVKLYLSFEDHLTVDIRGTDEDAFLVLGNQCVEQFTDEELTAQFGYSLAHIRYGHVRYLNIDKLLDLILARIPMFGQAAALSIKSLMLQWKLAADYTADRGAAIAAGRIEPAMQILIKGMGGGVNAFDTGFDYRRIAQEAPKERKCSLVGMGIGPSMIKRFQLPFGTWRIAELYEWYQGGECRKYFSDVYFNSISEFGLKDVQNGNQLYEKACSLASKDAERSLALMHAAGACGQSDALYMLGVNYVNGKSTLTPNVCYGFSCLRKAALQLHPKALRVLSSCFQKGYGGYISPNQDMANWLYTLLEESGKEVVQSNPYTKAEEDLRKIFKAYEKISGESDCRIQSDARFYDKEAEEIRRLLWIPRSNRIYAFERIKDDWGNDQWLALTDFGLYFYAGKGFPHKFSWKEIAISAITYQENHGVIEIYHRNRMLVSFQKGKSKRSIPYIIVSYRKMCGKK